jgi:hypothetical protein
MFHANAMPRRRRPVQAGVAARHAVFPAPAVAHLGLAACNSKATAYSAPISLNRYFIRFRA